MTANLPNGNWLHIDCPLTALRIQTSIRDIVDRRLKRRGVVVGLSGGIDSSVVAALCAHALGNERVLGLIMPERECSPESLRLGSLVAQHLHIPVITEEISDLLVAAGCYSRRDQAIRRLLPDFDPSQKCKLVMADFARGARYSYPWLIVETSERKLQRVRLTSQAYLEIVAASNFKQRVRAMLEYYHADRLQYAVAGTPNRLEFDQGFFVKNGDAAADLKPIAHLYKSQVRQLAAYFHLPLEVCERPATTDTFSLEQSQEEFYFGVSLETFDICLYAKNNGVPPHEVVARTALSHEQVSAVFAAIDAKRRATFYLHEPPVLVGKVPELSQPSNGTPTTSYFPA